ncbi:MAG: acyltransferase family protein [Maribacter arcticus]|uniref:acyltransferase family protein n=1 Tax=Maribacter arcticus TaxID=561365 RepID=UPI00300229AE
MVKVKKWIPFSIIILLALIFGNRLNSLKRDALFFNGEKHYVLLPQYLSDLNTGMIKIDFSYQNKSQRTLFSTSSSSSNTNNYSLNIADGLVQYYDRYNSVLVQSSTQLIPGVFYELLISYDNGKIEIFINGVLQKLNITYQGNNKKIGWFSHVIKDNEAPIYTLGAFKRPSQVKNQFTGYIREFQIFNEGLNNGEVDYNAFKKNKYDKNLKINYQFDLSDFSTFSYYKTVVAGGFINLSQPKGLKIDFNETTKNTLQFHLFSFILSIILIILLTFFTKKESLFILPKNYIKGFDGLRGISILLVIITHLGWFENIDIFGSYDRKFKYLLSGTTGVNIFFTLSGFLITNILLNELNKYGTINFKTFFLKRFIRLLPPLFLFLVIIFILMLSNILTTNYSGILYSFFYIYNFIPRSLYSAELGLTWSLSVEEQFYLFWPISIFFIRRKKTYLFY